MSLEVRFYHLVRTGLDRALPELLEKTLQRGWRAVVVAASAERVESLAEHLWTYEDRSFLPHGSRRDGRPDRQPIWLTDLAEVPNGASVVFQVDGAEIDPPDGVERICDLFDGTDPDSVANARIRYRRFLERQDVSLSYWQQDDRGRWMEKSRREAGEQLVQEASSSRS